jgi:hypothetical protein
MDYLFFHRVELGGDYQKRGKLGLHLTCRSMVPEPLEPQDDALRGFRVL